MSDRVHDYFKQADDEMPGPGHFHKVIALHEDASIQWDTISKTIPTLSRGWFELSKLVREDRIEFTRDYWFAKLSPHFSKRKEEKSSSTLSWRAFK